MSQPAAAVMTVAPKSCRLREARQRRTPPHPRADVRHPGQHIHTMLRDEPEDEGAIFCWGQNEHGALCLPSLEDEAEPCRVLQLRSICPRGRRGSRLQHGGDARTAAPCGGARRATAAAAHGGRARDVLRHGVHGDHGLRALRFR